MDYLLQCVGAVVLLHVKSVQEPCDASAPAVGSTSMAQQQTNGTGTVTSEDLRMLEVPLAKIMKDLQEHIPHLVPFLQEEFLVMLLKVLKPAAVMNMPGNACLTVGKNYVLNSQLCMKQ